MSVKLLTEHNLEFLSLKGVCTGSSESTHAKMPHCWKSNALALTITLQYRSTDEVFAALEENQVQLSTMKASRFVKAFEQEVDKWERTLSHILEVVEMLLTVQRQWMYLEVKLNLSQM